MEALTQFGVAGLMGVLWVWERRMSRRRERQLDEAHERLARRGEELKELIDVVRANTAAVERFERTQQELRRVLERMSHEDGYRTV